MNETMQIFEKSSGLMRVLSGTALALSGSLILPMLFGGIITVIGIITIWKRHIGLAVVSLLLAIVLMNWVGVILTIIGSILGFILWREHPVVKELNS